MGRIEKDFLGRKGDRGRRLLRRPDAPRQGEFPHHRHPDGTGALFRQGARLRQEGGRAWPTAISARSTPRSPTPSSRPATALIAGEMLDQFVTDFIQGGAGTSTNMNANEVIANLALEYLGHQKGEYQHVNPNDHVNFGQSTNDVYPTALRLALIMRLDELRRWRCAVCRTPSSPRARSSSACSRWGARICRTRCRCRSAPSSTAGAPRSARRCSASRKCASCCTRSISARPRSAPR